MRVRASRSRTRCGRDRVGRAVAAAGAATALILGAAGCGSSVSADSVASAIEQELTGTIQGAGPVTCPEDLPAEVGASVRCEFEVDGQPVDAVATVSSVEGGTANFDITTEARPVAAALLGRKVGEQVGQQTGVAIDSAECAGDLPPVVGESVICTVSGAGESLDVEVTVTAVDGGLINYSLQSV